MLLQLADNTVVLMNVPTITNSTAADVKCFLFRLEVAALRAQGSGSLMFGGFNCL